jgi:tRNA/tmRNA/rRNA uracil-C5-methylase (TrmA/RlmC/RlmD family)
VHPGEVLTVTAERIAHGGHVIAHAEGRTLLVRHALPGEVVRVRVTAVARRVVRADAVEVLEPSSQRVAPPCPYALACGGCDFQHVALPEQRRLKQRVIEDALQRFGGIDPATVDTTVHPLPDDAGLGWRTRMRWASSEGRAALRAHRSHALVVVDSCRIADPRVDAPTLGPLQVETAVAVGTDGQAAAGAERVLQTVGGREWRVPAEGFWQVHPALPGALQEAVSRLGAPGPGERWWDLFSGAGLLSAVLGERVGPHGRVDAVEWAPEAVRAARRALHDLPQVRLHRGDVSAWVEGRDEDPPDGIVLDPPRAGAGLALVDRLTGPTRIVYVACDPVALARDLRRFREHGYGLAALQAIDAFPMTHHIETVALIVR